MAFFGAPFRPEDHSKRAVQAALAIVAGMEEKLQGGDSITVEGSVATGEMFMGNLGDRFGALPQRSLELRGKEGTVQVRILRTGILNGILKGS